MGLPQIITIFKTKGTTAVKRSERGIVAVVLKDSTAGGKDLNIYKSILDVDFTQWTQRNHEYLKLIYEGNPYKVIAVRIGADESDLAPALKKLRSLRWNYLTIPGLSTSDTTLVSAWIKEARGTDHKTFKAVLPNCTADHEGIINFTTNNIKSSLGTTAFTTTEYCARIAGIMAGLSLARSSTSYELADIVSADTPDDPNERIDGGELVLVYDDEKFIIGRGVNSLTTFTSEKGEDFSKIKIIEGVDLYNDDIRSTFRESYSGKRINDYDNKQAWVAAIRAYQKELEGNVLDKSFDNTAAIDVDAQRTHLEKRGIDTSNMDETAIAKANTGATVFVASHVKFVDAMEDMQLTCHM